MEQRFFSKAGVPSRNISFSAFCVAEEKKFLFSVKTKKTPQKRREHKSSNTNLSISLNNGIYPYPANSMENRFQKR